MTNSRRFASLGGGIAICLASLAGFGCGNNPHIVQEIADVSVASNTLYPGLPFASEVDAAARLCRVQPVASPTPAACLSLSTDYTPGQDDLWPACISDSGTFSPIDANISTVARVEAFEEIASKLFDPTRDPTAAQFTEARMIYQREEGLDSRMVRRYDPHFCVPAGAVCTNALTAAAYPDYCVGPAKLSPLVLNSLNAGIQQTPLVDGQQLSRVYAARIEAGLLWFLYASHHKESLSCATEAIKDCDSAVAYYNGARPAGQGIGLARYVRAVDGAADDAAWKGALAVRCWRDLDTALPGTNLDLRERARDQFDRAVLKGLASILKARGNQLQASSDAKVRIYHWEFLRSLAPAIDREARLRNANLADQLKTTYSRLSPEGFNATTTAATLDSLFGCP